MKFSRSHLPLRSLKAMPFVGESTEIQAISHILQKNVFPYIFQCDIVTLKSQSPRIWVNSLDLFFTTSTVFCI